MKSAKRVLENLRLEYPDEPKIEEKLAALERGVPQVEEEISKEKEKEEKPIEEEKKEEPSKIEAEAEEGLEANLAQVDSYLEQGLVKSAKRVLENLRLEYPDEPKVEEKFAALEGDVPQIEEEIPREEEKEEKPIEEEKEEKPIEEEKEGPLPGDQLFQDPGNK